MGTATNFVVFDKSFQAASVGDASLIAIVATIQVLLNAVEELLLQNRKERRRSNGYIKCKRRSLVSIRNEYGNLFERAYRMDYPAFLELHELLKDGIKEYVCKEGTSRNSSANEPFYRENGKITTQIRLACALRYFAGGSYLDIIMSHSVGKTDFYRSIWAVVHATNQCSSLDFQFPSTLAECQSISNEFSLRSKAGFTNCIGCIDGLLIWLEKPSKDQCIEVGVDSGKFLCRRKGKFGLNLQGICDARRRFTYISIQHPASSIGIRLFGFHHFFVVWSSNKCGYYTTKRLLPLRRQCVCQQHFYDCAISYDFIWSKRCIQFLSFAGED